MPKVSFEIEGFWPSTWFKRAAAPPGSKPAEPQPPQPAPVVAGQKEAGDFFPPGNPRPGQVPETGGRTWAYPPNINLNLQPRTNDPNSMGISFQQLRLFGDGCTLLRIVMENRKNAITSRPWRFQTVDKGDDDEQDPEVMYVTEFFKNPDKTDKPFRTWASMLLEEAFVTDATTVYRRLAADMKTVYSLDLVDGATILPLVDSYGKRPMPPSSAYTQSLNGMPARNFTTAEMVYWLKSPRVWKLYGMSVVEQVLGIAAAAIERDHTRLLKYTDGSWPGAFVKAPEDWDPEKLATMSGFLNGMLSGNTGQKVKINFVPGDVVKVGEETLKDEFDEWLARIIAFVMGMSPQALVKEVNRATAETSRQIAIEEGLEPWMLWFKSLMDYLVQVVLGYPRLEFVWGEDDRSDTLENAQRDAVAIDKGFKDLDDARGKRGNSKTGLGPIMVVQGQIYSVEALVKAQDGGEPAKPLNATPAVAPAFGAQPGDTEETEEPEEPEEPKPEDEPLERRAKGKKKILMPPRRSGAVAKAASKATSDIYRLSETVLGRSRDAAVEAVKKLPDSVFGVQRADNAVPAGVMSTILDAISEIGFAIVEDEMAEALGPLAQVEAEAALAQLVAAEETEFHQDVVRVDEAAAAWAQDHAADKVKGIDQTTRDEIQDVVTRAFRDGLTRDELAAAIEADQAFSEYRSNLIAQTEVSETAGNAHLIGWQESGVVTEKTWLLSSDHPELDECDENAAQGPIPLDATFKSGDKTNPAHPGCFCTVAALVGGL